ncbi:hypothetical protein JCGZ_14858 [Jatropha curcas]|uniref:Uncharacterized protein n=1 Tax=Jatropha curcas TaxID=180498 RepID=A0A067K9D7_JATCU|nr:hypothetical protein JCGZ_14858 [Jatropha curcas]
MQVVEDFTDRLDDENGTYIEIGASDDEEEEDQIIVVHMARGKAVDSDAFGSGLCGGHGRRRSARGRGGTIPPPSSSGTSGASSSAQPSVPPSLPFVPSSSTPLPRLAEVRKSGKKLQCVSQDRGRVGRRLGKILHSRESVTYLHEIDAPPHDHSPTTVPRRLAHACVDEQERQLAELRAHVMRMSGQHGAETSSSDPPPATDRDVSTALHQPLWSPLDLDTADDTLVTPADTTTHLADTHADAMTLDRAEDRLHRFDFGPF